MQGPAPKGVKCVGKSRILGKRWWNSHNVAANTNDGSKRKTDTQQPASRMRASTGHANCLPLPSPLLSSPAFPSASPLFTFLPFFFSRSPRLSFVQPHFSHRLTARNQDSTISAYALPETGNTTPLPPWRPIWTQFLCPRDTCPTQATRRTPLNPTLQSSY